MRVSKSLVVKVGAAAATAAIALGGVAAADASTPQVAKVKTATILTARATPVHVSKLHPYGTARIAGRLTTKATPAAQVAGVRVWLLRKGPHGRWHVVRMHRTGRLGRVYFRVYHVAKGAKFELVFRGNVNFARSRSRVIVISAVSS